MFEHVGQSVIVGAEVSFARKGEGCEARFRWVRWRPRSTTPPPPLGLVPVDSAGGRAEVSVRKVVYPTSLSLDGYVEPESGNPGWAIPDEELHRHFNALEREIDLHLYGRRMYELMAAYWPNADENPSAPSHEADYARIWKAVPKVVFSATLSTVQGNARIVSGDPVEEVARLKAQPGKDMSVGGVAVASRLAAAGLIDEYRFYYVPILLGGGRSAFEALGVRVPLRPIETRLFSSGTMLLRCVPPPSNKGQAWDA